MKISKIKSKFKNNQMNKNNKIVKRMNKLIN